MPNQPNDKNPDRNDKQQNPKEAPGAQPAQPVRAPQRSPLEPDKKGTIVDDKKRDGDDMGQDEGPEQRRP